MPRVLLIFTLISSLSCRKIEPAPEEFDEIMHYLWYKADTGTDEELAAAIRNLHTAIDGETLVEPEDGTVSALTIEEVDVVGADGDPEDAPGVYLLDPFVCALDDLTEIVTRPDQDVLYPGVYDSYQRNYINSREDFISGSSHRLNWTLEYEATLLGSSYSATLLSLLRRVPSLDEEQSPFGEFLVWRAYLTGPANFGDSAKSLNQDYQIDIYYPDEDTLIHAYAIWREAFYGAGFSTEDEAVQRITLNNLIDWDEETERLCAEGLPE
jgi:hypothetical protein